MAKWSRSGTELGTTTSGATVVPRAREQPTSAGVDAQAQSNKARTRADRRTGPVYEGRARLASDD